MKTLILNYKFVFMTLMFLPLSFCSSDDGENDQQNMEVISLNEPRKFEMIDATKFGVLYGSADNPILYPTANLFFGQDAGFNISLVAGRFETNPNTNATLDISMILDRQATLEYNMQYRDYITVYVIGSYGYNNYFDTYISTASLHISSKNQNYILTDENGEVGVLNYPFATGEGTPWGNALFFETGNTSPTNEGFVFSDQNTFTEETEVTITQFTDYRMLTYLRYIMSKSNTTELVALKSDGTEVNFNLDYNSDLLALSAMFDEESIVKFRFEAFSDFDIKLFKGVITSDESPDGNMKFIDLN